MPDFSHSSSLVAQINMREFIDNLARTPLSEVVAFVAALTILRVIIFPKLMKTPPHKRTGSFALMKMLNELLDAFVYAGVFVFMLIRPFGVQAFLIPSGSMWPTLYVNDFIVANKAVYRYTDPKANDVVVFRPPRPATAGREKTQIDAEGNVKVDFIKRCIGTPNDIIELRKGVLYRNGQPDAVDDGHKHYSQCTDQNPFGEEDCQNFRELSDAEKEGLTKANFKLVNYKGKIIPLNWTDMDGNSGSPQVGYGSTDQQPPYSVAPIFRLDNQAEAKALEALPAEPIPKGMYLMMGDNRNGSFDSRGWGLVPREQIIGRAEFIWFPLLRMSKIR